MSRHRINPNTIMGNDASLQPGQHHTTPETKLRIIEVAKLIAQGWTKFEVTEWVKEHYGVKNQSATRYWNAGLAHLCIDPDNAEYIEEMRKKTIGTLDRLIQREIEEGRYKEANTSMDLLSRLMGYNVAKTETKVTGDIKFDFGGVPSEDDDA